MGHTAVWTGDVMIVWGGYDERVAFGTGAIYDPETDQWSSMSNAGAPQPRWEAGAVWTGSELIVWGGIDADLDPVGGGGIYDPATDRWRAMSNVDAPSARKFHQAQWTGDRLLVWGGSDDVEALPLSADFDVVQLYDPVDDVWTRQPTTGGGEAYRVESGVSAWTSGGFVLGGGWGPEREQGTAPFGRLAPDWSWHAIDTTSAPSVRINQVGAVTDTSLFVWGGFGGGFRNDGALYDWTADAWRTVSTVGAPSPREVATAVWTGRDVVVWGGSAGALTPSFADGGHYDPATDTWTRVDTNIIAGRAFHSAVWTGDAMIVFGGTTGTVVLGDGAIYRP